MASYFTIKSQPSGKFLFISGLDGNSQEQIQKIRKLVDHQPDYVFFLGDVLQTNHMLSLDGQPVPIKGWRSRLQVRTDIRRHLRPIVKLMTEFTKNGSVVALLEGDQEYFPAVTQLFSIKKYLQHRNRNVFFIDDVFVTETEEAVLVFWPYRNAVKTTMVPEMSEEIKNFDKRIVLISHAQIETWSIEGEIPLTSENMEIDFGMQEVMKDLHPHFVVHGHLEKPIDPYTGYVFKNQAIYYLPFGRAGFFDFPIPKDPPKK
jgi:hypothetical protein